VVARFRWNPDGAATDYDRACDVSDYVGLIQVGQSEGLVLGDEPNDTTWLSHPDGGLFVRWRYAAGEEQVEDALGAIPSSLAWQSAGELRVTESPLELFDSAEAGLEPCGQRLRVLLQPNLYSLSHAEYVPDAETAFQLIRLQCAAT
jgi:hypothetical protein